jgi:hypothetical protein
MGLFTIRFISRLKGVKKYVHIDTPEQYENNAKIRAYDRARRTNKWRAKIRFQWTPNVSKNEQFLTKLKGLDQPPQMTYVPDHPKVLVATRRNQEKIEKNRALYKKAKQIAQYRLSQQAKEASKVDEK